MPIQYAQPVNALLAGRQARSDEQRAAQQNALLQMQIEQAPQQMQDERELNALRRQQTEQQIAAGGEERKQRAQQQIGSLSQQALQSQDPRAFVAAALNNPAYQELFSAAGIDLAKAQEGLNSPDFERNLQVAASMGPQVSPEARFNRETAEQGRTAAREEALAQRQFTSAENAKNRQAQLDAAGARSDAQAQKQQKTQSAGLRKEFRGLQSVKDYETVLPLIQSAKTAPDTRQGDLQLIYTVGKVFDPGSVVREGELKLTAGAAPFLQQLAGKIRGELGKGRLTPQTRAEMLDALKQRVGAYEQAYTRDYDTYAQYAKDSGADPNAIVGSRPESAYQPQQGGAPVQIKSEADYGALPSGTKYIGPDGKLRQKR